MLPPVDPRVLERNPNFEVLYKDLTTRKLNPDGSTRDTKKQRMHDEIRRVSHVFAFHSYKFSITRAFSLVAHYIRQYKLFVLITTPNTHELLCAFALATICIWSLMG